GRTLAELADDRIVGDRVHQTPDNLRLAADSRSTRICMKARSNWWRQPSVALARLVLGTEMMLASSSTVTSAPRTGALPERYAISPNGSPALSTLSSRPFFVTLTAPCARMQKKSPGSPSFISRSPGPALRQAAMRVTSQSSASEKLAKNGSLRNVSKRSESLKACALRAVARSARK